jgi:uncharacterized membrane protein required for colicin V production
MTILIALGTFFVVVGASWWFGLWNNILTLINFFLAALIASSFYESLARVLQDTLSTYAFLLDFIALWLLFFLSFIILRGLTEVLSPIRLKFNKWVDIIGRSIVCIWLGIAVNMFVFFSLHMAPIPPSQHDLDQQFEIDPEGTSFLGLGPGQMWMAFIQSRSRGALSASLEEPLMPVFENVPLHPDDQDINCRVFDSASRLPVKYQMLRVILSKQESLRNEELPPRR